MENRAAQTERDSLPPPPTYEDVLKLEADNKVAKARALKTESEAAGSAVDRGMVVYVTVDPVSHPDDEQLVAGARRGRSLSSEALGDETTVDWIGVSFSDKRIRRAFIRKVFLILMCQLIATAGVVSLFLFCEPINLWIRSAQNFWFYYTAYGVFLVTYVVLACCSNVRRHWPGNLICLTIFTLSLSCMAGTISSFHDTRMVLVAFGMTAVVCLALSLFAIQTKVDFTLCSGLLFSISMVIFLFGVYCIVTGSIFGFKSQPVMTGVWGFLIALLFSMFLVFDIQQVVGGNSIELNPEEHIYGALHIYLDVVFLFMMLLSCSGRSQ